jgi:SPP1 gp7 family putative phage head morphogenesis protein
MPEGPIADPDRFVEASSWFRERVAVTRDEWSMMTYEARRQSFTLAGTQQLEVVQTVMASLQKAIDKGTPIDKWRKDIQESLGKKFAGLNPSYLDTAFINANQQAYSAGRWAQMNKPEVTNVLPWRLFSAVLDDATTDFCRACNGTIVRHDDPWLLTHCPQCHHRCRAAIRALSDRMAKRMGGETTKPNPKRVDGDWGIAPPLQKPWSPELSKYESHAAREYEKKQARMKAREAKRQARRRTG